jgi:hypothetical protein
MGIIYQCSIRCFKIKKPWGVNQNVFECRGFNWEKRLAEYKEESKENIVKVTAVYKHDPWTKWIHTLDKVLIPDETDVIAFGNNACDQYDMVNYYFINFYSYAGKLVGYRAQTAEFEHNHFMVFVPRGTHYISYGINQQRAETLEFYERRHNFHLTPKCSTCHPSYFETPKEFYVTDFNPECHSKAFT